MAVDQAGRDQRAAEVVLVGRACRDVGGQVGLGADPGDAVAVDEQCAALDPAPRRAAGEGREARMAPEGRAVHRGEPGSGV